MSAAVAFEKKMVAQQALLMAASFAALAAFVPPVLRLDESLVVDVMLRVLGLGIVAATAVGLSTRLRLEKHRYAVRMLAMESRAIEPHDVAGLRRLPNSTVLWHLVIGTSTSLLAAWSALRPAEIGSEMARELALLGVMTALATSVVARVLAQAAVARLLEITPLEPVTAHLAELAERGEPSRHSRRNLTFAVVVPIALVGVGGALASYAHLRAITDQSRHTTAVAISRSVVGGGEVRKSAGQRAAIASAKKLGYEVVLSDEERGERLIRTSDDRLLLTLPLDTGSVDVAFATRLASDAFFPLAIVALGFGLLGFLASQVVARLLSSDLMRATHRLRTLGTEAVLHGEGEQPFDARFAVVDELASAALALTHRFRVFAAAQERALEAQDNAQRMRGLLFASVSHDLKSPLNAIVGFADSIDRAALTPSQFESLDLIATRGRELVILIETILDAARVEAGQLRLSRRTTAVAAWLSHAARLARELSHESGELKLEVGENLPPTEIDSTYLPRALAVIIAHALRAPTSDGSPPYVVVRASWQAAEQRIRIDVDHGNTTITAQELSALFARQSSSRGRGLTLGLSLARSVFDLHGGTIDVQGEPSGPPLVIAHVPASAPSTPPAIRTSQRS